MWSSKRSPGPALLRRLCTLGLPLETVAPALMRALCREAQGVPPAIDWTLICSSRGLSDCMGLAGFEG